MGTALAALNTSHRRTEAQKISGDFFFLAENTDLEDTAGSH